MFVSVYTLHGWEQPCPLLCLSKGLAYEDHLWPLSHQAGWRIWEKEPSTLRLPFLSFLWALHACREHVLMVLGRSVSCDRLMGLALHLKEEACGHLGLPVSGCARLIQEWGICKPTWLADLNYILHYWLHQWGCLSTWLGPLSVSQSIRKTWVRKKDYELTLKLPNFMVLSLLRMEEGQVSCLPLLWILPAPPQGPPFCPEHPLPQGCTYLMA